MFPEGGGQPTDYGTIKHKGTDFIVDSVERNSDGEVWHKIVDNNSLNSLEVEEKVDVEVDWKRRFDHMQQHSGQHLLSAIAKVNHNLPTVSWSLTQRGNLCYVDLKGKEVKETDLSILESEVNKQIRNNLKFIPQLHDPNELDKVDAR